MKADESLTTGLKSMLQLHDSFRKAAAERLVQHKKYKGIDSTTALSWWAAYNAFETAARIVAIHLKYDFNHDIKKKKNAKKSK